MVVGVGESKLKLMGNGGRLLIFLLVRYQFGYNCLIREAVTSFSYGNKSDLQSLKGRRGCEN